MKEHVPNRAQCIIMDEVGLKDRLGSEDGTMEKPDSHPLFKTGSILIQEMIEEGKLSPDEAIYHPLRNMLTRALGSPEPLAEIEIGRLNIAHGDCFLLSSDGLHGLVPVNTIEDILNRQFHPKQSAQELLQAALGNGGKDNITIIVIDV